MYNDGPNTCNSVPVAGKEPVIREILDRTMETMGAAMKELSEAENKLYTPKNEMCCNGEAAHEDNSLESKAWKVQRMASYLRDKADDINRRI